MNNDDKNKNQNVQATKAVQDNQANQPQPQVQPVVPAVSLDKESEPQSTDQPTQKFIEPSEKEPQISPELKEAGVEIKKDAPDIADEHKQIINHAKQFTPVSTSPSDKITMPMSEEEISSKLQIGQDDDSAKWLAQLINKIMAVVALRKG